MLLTITALLMAFTSSAQTINGNTCISRFATSETYNYTLPLGSTCPTWSVLGDIAIVSSTSLSVTIKSTNTAKGRIILTYNQGSCSGQQIFLDVYKVFTWPDNIIVGPVCVCSRAIRLPIL